MANDSAIKTTGLVKNYGSFRALHGVDLEVKRGEIFGFLGPNGAGKTTTIRSLLDLIHRDGGSVEVLGLDPQKNPVELHRRVGYMPGELHLDQSDSAESLLRFFNELRGNVAEWGAIRKLADQLGLDLKQPIRNLSHGNKQKVGIVQTFMHKPELIIMDEPTQGLDPLVQQEVLQLLKQARDNGATVFFSSHIMSEVEAVAQRVGIIRAGRMVEVADPSSLGKRSLHRVHIRFRNSVDSSNLAKLEGVTVLSKSNGTDLFLQIEGDMDSLIKTLAVYPVHDFDTEHPSLEEAFLAYYEGEAKNAS
jgi:ABC-2 type transport system ATP-binding protein